MRDRALGVDRLPVVHGIAGQREQVDAMVFQRALHVQPRQQQQVVDQQAHPAGFALDARQQHATSRAAPCRYSSAKPRMVVSGVRSSWLASVMNRRIRSSEPRAVSAEDSEEATACWIWVSIPLSANDSRPTSVRGITFWNTTIELARRDRGGGLLDLEPAAAGCGAPPRSRRCRPPPTPPPRCRTATKTRDAHRVLDIGQIDRDGGQPPVDRDRHRSPLNIRAVDRATASSGWDPTSLSGGKAGSALRSLMAVNSCAVGADTAHVELRRWPAGSGPS